MSRIDIKSHSYCVYLIIFNLSCIFIFIKMYVKDLHICPKLYKILATGSSDNHFHLLLLFLYRVYNIESNICIIVWNLGLSNKNIKKLNKAKKYIEKRNIIIQIKIFDYSIHPNHFNININAGYYSWKPFVIWETYITYKKNMLWLDCGCFINRKLDYEYKEIEDRKLYSISAGTTIQRFTHAGLFNLMNVNRNIYNKTMCAGGVVGLYYPSKTVNYILNIWKACALIKNCISPPGANRGNHRQDQSVFSILIYQYNFNFKCKRSVGFSTHFDKNYKKYNDVIFIEFINYVSNC